MIDFSGLKHLLTKPKSEIEAHWKNLWENPTELNDRLALPYTIVSKFKFADIMLYPIQHTLPVVEVYCGMPRQSQLVQTLTGDNKYSVKKIVIKKLSIRLNFMLASCKDVLIGQTSKQTLSSASLLFSFNFDINQLLKIYLQFICPI